MEKMFIHIGLKSSFTAELQEKYANSIVFIKDSGEIFTHGKFYGLSTEWQQKITTAKNDIEALQTAVKALQSIYAFTTISDGTHNASATSTAKTIKFNASGKASVSVGAEGVTISASGTTLTEGTANGETSVDGVSKSIVKGLNTAAYHPESYFYLASDGQKVEDAVKNAQQTADSKVASVTATTGSAIEVTGEATKPTVGLKLDTLAPGNVVLSQSANGLKASVKIPEATVTGIVPKDKVLGLTGTLLSSTLDLKYNSDAKKIQLLGIQGAVIAEVDASAFIKDGMVKTVVFDPTSKDLTITFNTDSGKEDIKVNLSSLVDTYVAGAGITIEDNVVSVKVDPTSEFVSVGVDGLKVTGISTKISETKSEVIGKSSDNSTANTVYGAKAYAEALAKNYATAAQGEKADSALQSITKGTDGSYVTTTVGAKSGNSQSIATSVTVQAINSASSAAKGLAEASDVKSYVDNLFAWEEL